jgi:cytochrome c oxidase cbb3-type subunit 4
MGWVYGIVTMILMIVFISIVIWAWRAERAPDFDEAARLPLEDKEPGERRQ